MITPCLNVVHNSMVQPHVLRKFPFAFTVIFSVEEWTGLDWTGTTKDLKSNQTKSV